MADEEDPCFHDTQISIPILHLCADRRRQLVDILLNDEYFAENMQNSPEDNVSMRKLAALAGLTLFVALSILVLNFIAVR